LVEELKERDHLGDPNVDEGIILTRRFARFYEHYNGSLDSLNSGKFLVQLSSY
jgi:hypothetical protein